MDPASRYEILDTIASGDFAAIYRARDRELGREVAVKQIHQQFLSDPQQLARYWQEAQLLASLQHPHVLTIYDIVRSRGWLILELMQGSLKERTRGQPIDLDFLRVALAGCLSGLQFLHTKGVIHGDVKPSNLLVDSRNRVVLGDFGLARRASNEEGSLLKGTTKYMAPELVSNQFGAVGPASDLYSLGFSAYELMCGAQFETLFPGLSTFGRDKQIAWMMWHAAADRSLPEIRRVLEGVPEDLTRVIQKLIIKDQARRYQSARDVLRDLRTDPLLAEQPPEEEDREALAAAEAAAKKRRLLRFVAILACAFSLMLCVALLLPEKETAFPAPPAPTRGTISQVYPDEFKLAVASKDAKDRDRVTEIALKQRYHQVFINDKPQTLRELRPGDEVVIKKVRDESGREFTQVFAYRPEIDKGRIQTVRADEGELVLTIGEGDEEAGELLVSLPGDLKIFFNGEDTIAGRPVTLADLKAGDRVEVHHLGEESGRVATYLSAKRLVETKGIIRHLDAGRGQFTIAIGEGDHAQRRTLPFAGNCVVTLNGQRIIEGRDAGPADLKVDDEVTLAHDTQVVRVDAYRIVGKAGVVQRVHYDAHMLDVVPKTGGRPVTYIVGPECTLTLGTDAVKLTDLRQGDEVDITHDSLGVENPRAKTVTARRPPIRGRWALLIGIQDYEDRTLSRLAHPVADAQLLRSVLVKRYGVDHGRAELLTDESLVRLEQTTADWLGKIGPDGNLIAYFAGHAYRDDDEKVYLAPKNFDLKRIGSSGLPLQWLVNQLEQCPAKEKLLLLDCSYPGTEADLARQISTAEMIETLDTGNRRAPLRTVTVVASCRAGQRGLVWEAKGHGLFPWLLAEAYSGAADKNRDNRLEPTELVEFLQPAMAAAAGELGGTQTPALFLPDDRPPRLTEDARKAIRRLAAYLPQQRINVEAANQQYLAAEQLAGREPEPKLLFGLLLLKAKLREDALTQFEELKIEHPEMLFPLQAMAWAYFEGKRYQPGINELTELVKRAEVQTAASSAPDPRLSTLDFQWTGQLREFAAAAAKESLRPPARLLSKLDAAVAAQGSEAAQLYQQGRARSAAVAKDFDGRIENATGAELARLKMERHRLVHYATFPFDDAVEQILAGLQQ